MALSGNAGMSPWDCRQLANRVAKSPELDQAGFLICNDVSEKSWGPCFSNIANLIALTFEEQGSAGILIAINKLPASPPAGAGANRFGHTIDPDLDPARTPPPQETHEAVFRPGHATALAAFASLLSMHAHASLRYLDLKGLVVGLTRSLTAAIDAKDAYTYGHSERVARVAVELARELELQDDEIRDAYLAGLLHDVGKIGICEAVLSKRGPLDSTEMDHMKQHVVIGCTILADLHAIRHLIPGVRSHHERYDGRGYPDGLKGDEIPLLARILAVADAYDAMNTSRPYRSGMQPERIEEILRSGAGSQWDTRVVDAYFRCREKVIAVRQKGVGESLRQALSCAVRPA